MCGEGFMLEFVVNVAERDCASSKLQMFFVLGAIADKFWSPNTGLSQAALTLPSTASVLPHHAAA